MDAALSEHAKDVALVQRWHTDYGPPPDLALVGRLKAWAEAHSNDADTLMALADIYADSDACSYNPDESRRLIELSAGIGSTRGKTTVAYLAVREAPNASAAAPALKLLQARAAAGNGEAERFLGILYTANCPAVAPDRLMARKLFLQAADHGALDANLNVGMLEDEDPNGDKRQAVLFFQKAAALGSPKACIVLAFKYFKGDGVEKSNIETFAWMKKAVAMGSLEAQADLAELYEKGIGIPSDPVAAQELAKHAAELGGSDAAKLCEEIYLEDRFGGKFDRAEGMRWLAISAERHSPSGMVLLGILKLTGVGLDRDVNGAKTLFNAAKPSEMSPGLSNIVAIMMDMIDDPQRMQSLYDKSLRSSPGKVSFTTISAIASLSGILPDRRGVDPKELLVAAKNAGDSTATVMLRLLNQ